MIKAIRICLFIGPSPLSDFVAETSNDCTGIDVEASTKAIVLNADELTVDKAVLDTDKSTAAVELDARLQRSTLTFTHRVPKERHPLIIDYHGVIGVPVYAV